MNQRALLFTIVFSLVFPFFAAAQSPLDSFIAKQVRDYKVPGLAIGIIKNHQVVFKQGYGVTNTATPFPVSTETIFPINSCTKAFTAAAMGILVDQGKLSWTDKVIKHLPNFTLADPWITKQLTISDLLSHRSGLRSYDGDLLWYGTSYTPATIAEKIRHTPIRQQFRVDFGYQNVLYIVAGLVIEKVSGKPYADFVQQYLFAPLGMKNSSAGATPLVNKINIAQPHLKDQPVPTVSMHNCLAAGGINSTIDDMLRWMQMWLGQGRISDTIIINENAFETITTIKTSTSPTAEKGYGFGWYINYNHGIKTIYHEGGMPGYKSSVILYPGSGDGIVILTNKISPINDQLIPLLRQFLDDSLVNYQQADKNMLRKTVVYPWDKEREGIAALDLNIPAMEDYTGTYEDKVYDKAIIRVHQGKATLSLLPTKELFTGNLYYSDNNHLKIVFNDGFIPTGEVHFKRGSNKKVTAFTLQINTGDFHFGDLYFRKLK